MLLTNIICQGTIPAQGETYEKVSPQAKEGLTLFAMLVLYNKFYK